MGTTGVMELCGYTVLTPGDVATGITTLSDM